MSRRSVHGRQIVYETAGASQVRTQSFAHVGLEICHPVAPQSGSLDVHGCDSRSLPHGVADQSRADETARPEYDNVLFHLNFSPRIQPLNGLGILIGLRNCNTSR